MTRPGWAVVVAVMLLASGCGGGGTPRADRPSTLSMTVGTSSDLIGQNIDDVRCELGARQGPPGSSGPLGFTVMDEAGTVIGTGSLAEAGW